jgi:DNA-binding transcriptional LysR family regulator
MDIAALQVFLAVAESGSISAAAERVHLTQPAVSKRIQALERGLGVRLFDRIGRTVPLTEAGRTLRVHALRVLRELDDAQRSVANLAGTVGGELALATSHHVGLHRLPPALKRFHAGYPQVRLNLRFMDSEQACQAVAHGDIELAIVTLPPVIDAPLHAVTVWDDPLDFVVSPDHPLAGAGEVTVKKLLDHPAILPGPGTFTREIILNALGANRARVQVGMATNYLEVLKMLAAIGLGWSALPRTLIDDSLSVVQIRNTRLRRTLGVVTHRGRTLSNAARAMIAIVTNGT